MPFQDDLLAAQGEIQAQLNTLISEQTESQISEAMAYACQGGKRLRGFLALEWARMLGANHTNALRVAAAIEAVHAYSLVHDDLPCMDDDNIRRGQPTVHVKWDDATAVLVGDALQTLAFEILADPVTHNDPSVRAELVATLARASGASGMVLGQALDIQAESATQPLTLDQIKRLQNNKTGQLLIWPCHAAALLAGEDPAPAIRYAQAIGLAFQIADDILDVEGTSEVTGKAVQKDADAGKATFVSLMGLEAARQEANALVAKAEAELSPYGENAATLREIARYIVARDH